MQEVFYELREIAVGEEIERPAYVAGYFYHVLSGQIAARGNGKPVITAGPRDTVSASGFVEHVIANVGTAPARLLVGAEPYEYLSWLPGTFALGYYPARSENPLIRRLLLAMELVIEEISHPELPPDQLTLERTAELIIFYFFRMENPANGQLDPFPWSDKRLMAAVAAMQQDPAHNWTIDQLASIANMSRSAFAERFKQVLNVSPIKMLTEIRMSIAARLMLQGNRIADIAAKAGYGSEEALIRAFKRYYGETPLRWRHLQSRRLDV